METREEARFIKFAQGEVVEGILLSVQPISIQNKPATRYIVSDENGEMVSFLGTYQLNEKLRPADRGHKIIVRCEGEDVNVKRGDNCMKVFDVKVSRELVTKIAPSSINPEITDGDIPF
jgi:hypothetical protein